MDFMIWLLLKMFSMSLTLHMGLRRMWLELWEWDELMRSFGYPPEGPSWNDPMIMSMFMLRFMRMFIAMLFGWWP